MRYPLVLKKRAILLLSGLLVSLLAISLVAGPLLPKIAQAANPPAYVSHTESWSSSWRSDAVFSHTVASGSYQLLAVAVIIRGDKSVSSITYSGESLTRATFEDGGGSDRQRVELWYLVNPPVGTADVIVHFASSVNPSGIAAVNFTGVDQSDPIGATAGASSPPAANNDATTDITTENADSLIFGAVSARGGDTDPFGPGTDITELWNDDTGTDDATNDDGLWGGYRVAHTAGGGGYQFQARLNSADHWAIACLELKAAPAPSFTSISPDKLAYKDGDTISLRVTLEDNNTACTLTADFSNIDDQYVTGAEDFDNWGTDGQDNNGDGHIDEPAEQGIYVITYAISTVNSIGDGSYSVPVTATDGVGNSTTDNSTSLTLDNTAPPSPSNLVATAIAGGSIQLTWTLPSSEADVSRYNIYGALTSGGQDFSNPLDYVSKGTATYTDASTTSGTTYYYVVRAQDVAGNTDTNTTEASATAGITTGPSFSSITSDKSVYKDGDTITLTVTLANHNTGCTLTADFSNIDDQYVTRGESVVNWGTDGVDNNGDGKTDEPAEQGVYVISYLISLVNTRADGSHSVPVTATDGASNTATSSISLTLDNTAPPASTNLSATAIAGGIRLTWTASSSTDAAQYNIYRATSSGGQNYSSPTYTVSSATTTYTDTSTTDGQTYYYVVRAQDSAGNIETNTNEVSATASGGTGPPPPTNLTAMAIAGGSIQLTWTASSPETDVAQYNIYRATASGGEDYSYPTYTVSVGTTTYTDTSTTDGVTYYYVVRAQDNVGNIETNTNEVSATASTTGPSFSSISADKSSYKDGDTITLTVILDNHNTGCTLTANFSNIDDQYITGGESVVNWGTDGIDNDGDGHVDNPAEQGAYVISYLISTVNTRADGSHNVPVTATNAAGNSTSSSTSLTLDNTAPPAPTNLSATAISGGGIKLTWAASSPETDVSQYNIYRAITSAGQDYSSTTYTVSAGITTYTDTATTNGQTYYYVVRAQDAAGNIETNTNEVSATASGTGSPAPTNLSTAAIAGGSIQLTWTASSPETNVAQYNVYRATSSGGQNYNSSLASVSAGTTTYTDTTTTDGVTYYYVVRAQDNIGNIETNTNEASATADATPPPAPTNLVATAITGNGIQLSWTASSPETDVSQYNIYRATSSGDENYSSLTYTVSVGTTAYTDTATTDGVTYYYVVRAQDAAGNIETNTNEVSSTASVVGPSASVSQIYIEYGGEVLYDLSSSTDSDNPTVFAKGKIDEIYLRLNLTSGFELSETSSSITLFKGVGENAEQVSGSQEINQGTGWAELSFHLDPVFDPDVDDHSRDDLYWVDATAVDTAGNTNNFDFYFIYDTTSPSAPHFQISSFDSTSGSITVSGETKPDELSDPQQVEIFINDSSKGTATADANYEFSKSGIGLVRGTNYIAVQSTDKAGNKSALSKSLKLKYNPEGLLSMVIRSPHVVRSGSSTEPVKIIYSVTQPAEVTIRIFNLKGEMVKEWRGYASPRGEIEWNWYGRNMYEENVNNGVYIFRIKAKAGNGENDSSTKLVAVLR